jgi:hypothetical protein
MTKQEMAQTLTQYYPVTTTAYWLRNTADVIKLNYDIAVRHYGLLPIGRVPSPQASLAHLVR